MENYGNLWRCKVETTKIKRKKKSCEHNLRIHFTSTTETLLNFSLNILHLYWVFFLLHHQNQCHPPFVSLFIRLKKKFQEKGNIFSFQIYLRVERQSKLNEGKEKHFSERVSYFLLFFFWILFLFLLVSHFSFFNQ